MKKGWSASRAGFSLVEVLLAASMLGLVVMALVGSLIYGQESTALAGTRTHAVLLAEEGLEAVRNIRDEDFSNLTDGTHGLAISSNEWGFSGGSDVTGIFTRATTISTVDSDTKSVTSTVTWQQNLQRSGSVVLITYFTNWAASVSQGQGLNVNTGVATIGGGGDKELQGITIENTGAIDITIDKITVEWTNGQLIEEIKIDNTRVWKHNNEGTPDGRQSTGTELDIEDFELTVGSGVFDINKFKFNGDMTGDTFTITFTLGDGSTKVVVVDFSGGGPSCGDQADDFVIDILSASIGGGGDKELQDLTIQNTNSSCDITIDKITTTWDNSNLIDEVKIDGTRVWKHNNEGTPDGKQSSGTELDIVDFILQQSDGILDIDKFKFDGDMTGTEFTILFTFGDATTKLVNIDLSGGGGPSCGDQSDTFTVDSSGANIGGGGNKELRGITLENTDASCPITIDKITVTWDNSQLIDEVKIDGTRVWKHNNEGTPDGKQPSGTELDIVDFILQQSDGTLNIDKFKFNGNMTSVTFSITFTMGDATTKTVSNIQP